MHELGYSEGVLEAVLRRAGDRRVARVGVRIGAVHRVAPEAFDQSFRLAAAGSPADGATTEVVVVPVRGHCWECAAEFEAADPAPACPACGALEVAVEGGDEVVLEWLQYTGGQAPTAAGSPVPPHTHAAVRTHREV